MCYCGATDCPSCGPAQGYEVRNGKNVWRCADCRDEFDEGDLDDNGRCQWCAEVVAEDLRLRPYCVDCDERVLATELDKNGRCSACAECVEEGQ